LAGVVFIDVLQGMIIGVLASLLFVVFRSSRPHVSSLGRVPGAPGSYSDLALHTENTPVPGVLIARVDGQLYYANALTVRARVKDMISELDSPPRAVIIDCSAWYEIDLTSSDVLKGLVKELHRKGIEVYMTEVHVPVLDYGRRTGLLESVGEDHVFPTVDLAVRNVEASH
jgi:MFS superfamily sulfate permease-like transporter